MKKNTYTSIIRTLGCLLLLPVFVSSCLYEEPELTADGEIGVDPTAVNIMTNLTLETSFDLVNVNRGTRAATATYLHRFVVAVYDGTQKVANQIVYQEIQVGETTVSIPVTMKLHARKYQFAVWADYVEKTGKEVSQTFYNATDMAFILRSTPYRGNSRYYDAFYGSTLLDLTAYRDQWNVTVPIDIKMVRPMASYNLIATDVAKFLKKVADKEITGKKFTMTVKYNYYLPTGFDALTGKLKHSLQYMEYNKTVDLATLQRDENKAEFNIALDYLLVNNEAASSIPVTIEIANESKVVVARYQNLKIPYERNKETSIRGYFLTASPGINFDPDFNDDDIIIDVTPIIKKN